MAWPVSGCEVGLYLFQMRGVLQFCPLTLTAFLQSAWRKSQHQVTEIRTIHQICVLPCHPLHYLSLHYPCLSLSQLARCHYLILGIAITRAALAPFSAPALRQSVCFENRRGWINLAKLLLNQPPLAAQWVKEGLVYFLTLGRKVYAASLAHHNHYSSHDIHMWGHNASLFDIFM